MIIRSKYFALILVVVLSLSFTVTTYASTPVSAAASGSRISSDDEFIDFNEKVVWEKVEDLWRCVDLDGDPVLGWAKRGELIFFLGKDGFPKTGWIKSNGKWYYFYDEKDLEKLELSESFLGTMATDTWIDNLYYVDKTGAQVKTKKN
ncbi:MAG: hypothetical protein Q4E54_02835 [Lachnospiraceae bacterium]|nr:hypothetical protein [Lachnospiraceae bacterium]